MCAVTQSAQILLPPSTQAPASARAFLRAAACRAHNARVLDEAELLVSELATNAVLHGAPPITVHVECDGSVGLRVSVSDLNPHPPHAVDVGPEDESGRGITLVDVISDRWGVNQHLGDGKEVWFQLGD